MSEFPSLTDAVTKGDAAAAVAAARAALDAGAEPIRLVSEGIGPAMTKVGRLFEEGDCFVPELLMAARANKEVFEILRPLLARTGTKPAGRVVLGTVKGDMHDIGKNLVAALLEGGGFEVIDLGVDVPAGRFVAAVQEQQPQILGPVRAPHHHAAGDEGDPRGAAGRGTPRARQGHGGRRAGHRQPRAGDRRRRVRRQRRDRGRPGPAPDRKLA